MLTHQQDAQRHRRKKPASQNARKPIAAKTQHANTKKGAKPGAPPNFAPFACETLIRRANRAPPGPQVANQLSRCAVRAKPRTAFMGVRMSCAMRKRNSVFASFAERRALLGLRHFAEMRHVQPRQERVHGFRCHFRLGIAARGDGNVQNGAGAREQISSTATNAAPSA